MAEKPAHGGRGMTLRECADAEDGGPLSAGGIAIGVGLDAQAAYEDALALARAWLAFAAELERSGRVTLAVPALRPERALRILDPTLPARG